MLHRPLVLHSGKIQKLKPGDTIDVPSGPSGPSGPSRPGTNIPNAPITDGFYILRVSNSGQTLGWFRIF